MTTFFTSDMHFGHVNILKYTSRPWSDVDQMTKALINNWNEVVDHGDLVIIAGDSVMGIRHKNLPLMKHLHGFTVLFPGNHDHCHPMYAGKHNFAENVKLYKQYFDDILDATVPFEYEEFVCSHFPYNYEEADRIGRDFSEWEPKDEGRILLHGHVHKEWQYALSERGTPMVNVGVDVWNYTPVSIETIRELILSKR